MTTAGAARSTVVASPIEVDDDASAPNTVVVYNCTRLGLVANPPGFSLIDLFRRLRRR